MDGVSWVQTCGLNYKALLKTEFTKTKFWSVFITDTLRGYDPRYVNNSGSSVVCGKISKYRITATDCSTKLPFICVYGKFVVVGRFWRQHSYDGFTSEEDGVK